MHLDFKRKVRILDFDIEARPLSWYAGDLTSREVTAIAARFLDEPVMYCFLLGTDKSGITMSLKDVLENFRELYDKADMVTGHYIRGFDLPNVNGAMIELGLPTLEPKLTHDTKLDAVKWSGSSKSQENISAMLDIQAPKIGMTQTDWREANRLEPNGLEKTRHRVTGDVEQHIEMRAKMLKMGLLKSPKYWSPHNGGRSTRYEA